MDVDNGQQETTGNLDVEQALLQQFSCMGTTDKDELVQQLQKLLGTQLNYNTATFFLDMNNWNLQAAICSYLDVEAPCKLPSMGLLADPRASECESIEPSTTFKKTWWVTNNGMETWPAGCYIQCAGGENLGGGRVQVPALEVGTLTIITVEMTSPAQPGMYQSKWRLCTASGSYFGDTLWVIITVTEERTMELTQQLSHFSALGSPPITNAAVNPFVNPRATSNCNEGPSPTSDTDTGMC